MQLPYALKCDLIARQEKLELVKAVIAATYKAVQFVYGATLCPVCAVVGVQTTVTVIATEAEIRRCVCPLCDSRIKAVGDVREMPNKETLKPVVKKGAGGNTKGKGRRRGNR
jgi:hypothetical protein